jgi:3-methylcrotonyl-CoA carboxylase alpha subunit
MPPMPPPPTLPPLPPLERLLIANRGEIACRIARTARRLGIRTVAVYSEADASARHVAACDEAVGIGGRTPAQSYLRMDAILEAARRTGAQAVHPGYGFLSENAEFAASCQGAGLLFVGPPAAAIRAMGSKSAAKALMERAGVPLTPGFHGEEQGERQLQQAADRIGYPVLIKASAGGGGRGMRRVDRREDFSAALSGCKREAAASFGDDRVLIEKYVLRPRHIELQVFADSHGHCLHLFERDCSVQRRHQKVLEEAPAPGMSSERRAAMGAAAVAAASAVGYVGAGTVEFIVAPGGEFFFMEMNTRLQVEHPVTEMITGLDLVEWQLRVAAGEALPLSQEQLTLRGHAIEARLYAEDPARGFLPATGRLEYFAAPDPSAHVRLDAGVGAGDEITPYYDAMIGKLIVWDQTRELALVRLRQALEACRIVGVTNNVAFLQRLVASPAFSAADLDTSLIERQQEFLFPPEAAPEREAWLAAAVAILQPRLSAPPSTPWETSDGWRHGSRSQRTLVFRSGQFEQSVGVRYLPSGWELELQGKRCHASGAFTAPSTLTMTLDTHRCSATVVSAADGLHLFLGAQAHHLVLVDPLTAAAPAMAGPAGLRAPMPGRVIELFVAEGSAVAKGAALLVLEAMKIEHTIVAPGAGTVRAFKVSAGEQVSEGAELVDFVPADHEPPAR